MQVVAEPGPGAAEGSGSGLGTQVMGLTLDCGQVDGFAMGNNGFHIIYSGLVVLDLRRSAAFE